jgi:hypothetical protein
MNDIVERLRAVQRQYAWSSTGTPVQASVRDDPLSQEAADEIERLRNNADNLRQEIEDLRAERDALKVDAERYRWLRFADRWPCAFASSDAPEPLIGVELDAAIDAARRS